MKRTLWILTLWTLPLLHLLVQALIAAEWRAGAAKVPITPQESVWLSGYGSRDKPSQGVAQELYAKALAVEAPGDGVAVFVTTDLIGFSRPIAESIAARVQSQHGLARQRLLLTSSHTHAGPAIRDNLPVMYALTPEQTGAFRRYSRYLEDQVVKVVSQALAALAPARLSFHRGEAGFAVNRREPTEQGIKLGVNPSGPVDHDVPALRVDSLEGGLRAVLFSYACHNTTLGGDFYQFHGDYSGSAQQAVEEAHPGAVALFMMGCGGDANPHPRGTVELAERHGRTLARAVSEAIEANGRQIAGDLAAAWERVAIPLAPAPSRQEFEARLNDENEDRFVRRHAALQLETLREQGRLPADYPMPVQAVRLGPVTMIALGGEVVVDYALRLKKELGEDNVWVVAYANDVFAYVPSKRVLREGGYEAERSQIYYGMPSKWAPELEEIIIKKVHQIVRQVRSE